MNFDHEVEPGKHWVMEVVKFRFAEEFEHLLKFIVVGPVFFKLSDIQQVNRSQVFYEVLRHG